MKVLAGALVLGVLVSGCSLLSPPPGMAGYPRPPERTAPGPLTPGSTGEAPSTRPTPFQGTPPQPPAPAAPLHRQFTLGPAATALVGEAHAEERTRNFGLAAQTLERALSIEPGNPLVWIELGRENILAGNAAQAYGMGRKALYLASGDPHTQARAWQLIAASLREQGRASEAYAAEERAAALSQN